MPFKEFTEIVAPYFGLSQSLSFSVPSVLRLPKPHPASSTTLNEVSILTLSWIVISSSTVSNDLIIDFSPLITLILFPSW